MLVDPGKVTLNFQSSDPPQSPPEMSRRARGVMTVTIRGYPPETKSQYHGEYCEGVRVCWCSMCTVISPWVMNLSDSSKERDGSIFKSCDISLKNTPTSHAVGLGLFMYPCSDSAMPLCHALACAVTENGVCLLNLLVPSCFLVLLA